MSNFANALSMVERLVEAFFRAEDFDWVSGEDLDLDADLPFVLEAALETDLPPSDFSPAFGFDLFIGTGNSTDNGHQ